MTLTFLAITIFFVLGNAAFTKVFYFSIQPDQWMDDLFGWQNNLEKFGSKTGFINKFLYKAGGGCTFCFAHATSFAFFWIYVLIMVSGTMWPTFDTTFAQGAFNFTWYLLYISFGTTIGNLIITRK